jgi:hypothetical protein
MAPKKSKRTLKKGTNMTTSVTIAESSPVLTLTTEKRIFLDDPTQTQPITIDQSLLPAIKNNDFLSTRLIDYLVQRSVITKGEQRTVIASCMSMSLMQTYLVKDWHTSASHELRFDELQKKYQYYSFGAFRFFCLVCSYSHYYLVSLNFNATDPNKRIFSDVKVYDSMFVFTEERVEKDSKHAEYLMTLQQFLSTFSFNNSPNNEILLKDKHYILQDAKYLPCPQQQNGCDCSLFGLGTLLHVIEDLPIDDKIFGQEDITLFREDLYSIFTRGATSRTEDNPLTSLKREFIFSFYPKLFEMYRSKKRKTMT